MKRNSLIDFVKIGLALLVVCLHFPTFIPSQIIMPIARIGVPMFFIFSGYFVGLPKSGTDEIRAKKNIKSSFKYMLFGLVVFAASALIYLIYSKGGGELTSKALEDIVNIYNLGLEKLGVFWYIILPFAAIVIFFVFNLPDALGLWYVIALFTVAVIHYIFIKLKKEKLYPYISVVLLIIALMLGQYSTYFGLSNLPSYITRNAVFTGFPMFALGFWFAKKQITLQTNLKKYIVLAIGIIFLLLQVAESYLIDPLFISNGRLYASTLFACVFIFLFTISTVVTVNLKYLDPKLVFYIYIFHQQLGGLLQELVLGFDQPATSLITFMLTFIIFEAIYLVRMYIKNKKIKSAEKKEAT